MEIQMDNEIRLLDASLLSDQKKLKEISYWLKVMNRPNGWHYDLDQIWILEELAKASILPGSTIIDAGAGQGVMQYLLAARGYNVISLDFSPRTKPSRSLGIFNIVGEGDSDIGYQHPYMKFISYGTNSSAGLIDRLKRVNLKKILLLPQRIFRYAISVLFYLYERFARSHGSYGTITYLRAPFHEVPLASKSVDAVYSISAIEHADISLFHKNIKELLRLLKPQAPLLLTTSMTTLDENTYHEKTSGWCYSLSELKKYFPNCEVKFDAENCARSMIGSETFMGRLDPYYYQDKDEFCYKKCIESFPYLPVAVKYSNDVQK
jgi:ubiquinone/menaquinone biosynthesis C-methylase UbiE